MTRKSVYHNAQDEWKTPIYAVDIIAPYVSNETIWCPFDTEDSNYVKRLRELGHIVHATHISKGQDFLTYKPDFAYDAIVSNPPFSIKNDILERCLQLGKPFALLLPFTMFYAKKTIRLIHKQKIQLLMTDQRISFNGERPSFGSWYVCKGMLDNDIETYLFDKDPRELWRT